MIHCQQGKRLKINMGNKGMSTAERACRKNPFFKCSNRLCVFRGLKFEPDALKLDEGGFFATLIM